jgi:hypothetical protein
MARGTRSALVVVAIAATITITIAGCGLGAGPGTSNVVMTVTRDFGAQQVQAVTESHVPGSETVMRMLERKFNVSTRYGGGFVQSIDGLSGDSSHNDWFYYVNGVEAPKGAANTALNKGDRVWWDLHDWTATDSIPAVVGSFPEPFLHGVGGKRLPTTLECASDAGRACTMVEKELDKDGVPVAGQYIGTGSGPDTLGVVVGTWKDLSAEVASGLIEHGPSASGVYARFANGGSSLQLLDPDGHVAQTLTAGAGLVAATADSQSEPTWLITGTDPAGVLAAAHAVNEPELHDHFALAVAAGRPIPVPVGSG